MTIELLEMMVLILYKIYVRETKAQKIAQSRNFQIEFMSAGIWNAAMQEKKNSLSQSNQRCLIIKL